MWLLYNEKVKKQGRIYRKMLKNYFLSKQIEYFAVLSYENCREINQRIIDRQGFQAKSVIIYLLPYYAGETDNLSRYASSYDYHLAIADINAGLENALRKKYPDANIRGYGDHSPIDERHAALIASLGILGDLNVTALSYGRNPITVNYYNAIPDNSRFENHLCVFYCL